MNLVRVLVTMFNKKLFYKCLYKRANVLGINKIGEKLDKSNKYLNNVEINYSVSILNHRRIYIKMKFWG